MAVDDVLADLTPESLAVVEKIGAEVVARRLELHDDFADFDRLRSRGITPEQFTRVLTLHRIALTPEEREALIRQFGWAAPTSGRVGAAAGRPPSRDSSPLPPSASSSAGVPVYVNYEAFLRSLKGCLARAKSAAGIPRGAPWTGETDPPAPLPFPEATEEAAQLNAVLHRLREVARSRGLHLVKAFTGMDPLRSGKVTTSQFTRCVENVFPQHLGLLLAPFSTASKRGGNAPPTAAGNETERGDGSGKDGKGNAANGWEIPSGKPRTMLDLLLRAYGDGNGKVRYLAWCRAVEGGGRKGRGRPRRPRWRLTSPPRPASAIPIFPRTSWWGLFARNSRFIGFAGRITSPISIPSKPAWSRRRSSRARSGGWTL
ncbi:unnamed protein product [Phytomonas sp. EM1]|nr:unnamed protein product [Phytomonas sp. EM1]|eukprot:CCW63501.1 unnamed protein product [Phytomonas sp. isolate EM1]